MTKLNSFDLVAVRPVAGKRGELVFSMTKYAANISEAVSRAKKDIEGSGLVVLQAASYHADEPANNQMLNALIRAHDKLAA